MKTEQLVIRDFNGFSIEQKSTNKFLNATSLLQGYNRDAEKIKSIGEFLSNKGTKLYLEALADEVKSNMGNSLYLETDLYTTKRGVGGGTYMHPYLFVKFAMWLNPKFEVQVMKWIYDNLIHLRNEVGDHYKEMTDAIEKRYLEWSGGHKANPLIYIQEANFLKELAFGYRQKSRNEATELELKLLNALQLANIRLIEKGVGRSERRKSLVSFAQLYS